MYLKFQKRPCTPSVQDLFRINYFCGRCGGCAPSFIERSPQVSSIPSSFSTSANVASSSSNAATCRLKVAKSNAVSLGNPGLSPKFLSPTIPLRCPKCAYSRYRSAHFDRGRGLFLAVSPTGRARKRPQVIRPRTHNPRSEYNPTPEQEKARIRNSASVLFCLYSTFIQTHKTA